jgi:hypothetical protein
MALRQSLRQLTLFPVPALLTLFASCSSSTSSTPGGDGGGGAGNDGGGGADTWTSYAAGFTKAYCTECHDPQDSTGRDYNLQAKVEAEKLVIRCGVAVTQDPTWNCAAWPPAKQFPVGSGPKPSDAERARIVAWISAGAP